ncbi:ferritin-like domain-containing protein [Dyadobacter fanqingshengii]|uniref:PA2169 family four-helix-bundle protein n=1 Tax=Dyadobacter fanqingshengii TaxID=2906443 RepID=A0A9X1TG16_9BACT|nr:PA2169 family four-helix-bundle protein [Dyadobacter fanqingshengii]MCF0040072.1 PA2169 family four-helix-bundle protein [Dyadobacter fanqingshengii]MCF2502418.1 PA2169 family four-helix-bundle protein [Dyadobacter fanqingshengii]USJ38176.1 PA2169 family four-helix-bundle protein [Dyadobacter fanqingshengii]
MATTDGSTSVINDLIEINNDRVAGFEKVIADINDENIDLKALFQEYAEQSRKYGQELAAIVGSVGSVDEVETGNSVSGTLHRAWIDVKSLFGGSDRASILSEAERGEDAIKKAYQDALSSSELPYNAVDTIRTQAQGINSAHDKIKLLRDAAKA